jgi:microcystin-dependent protein
MRMKASCYFPDQPSPVSSGRRVDAYTDRRKSPGLSSYAEGQAGGAETVTLAAAQMPGHTHPVKASSGAAASDQPEGRALSRSASHIYTAQPDSSTVMNANMLGDTGGSQSHDNIQPYLAVNFCIALNGIYPSRS